MKLYISSNISVHCFSQQTLADPVWARKPYVWTRLFDMRSCKGNLTSCLPHGSFIRTHFYLSQLWEMFFFFLWCTTMVVLKFWKHLQRCCTFVCLFFLFPRFSVVMKYENLRFYQMKVLRHLLIYHLQQLELVWKIQVCSVKKKMSTPACVSDLSPQSFWSLFISILYSSPAVIFSLDPTFVF